MKLNLNVYQVEIMCHVQLRLLSVSELWPFDCVLCLFCIINILVYILIYSRGTKVGKVETLEPERYTAKFDMVAKFIQRIQFSRKAQ